jgi:hypothetical protein
MDASDDVTEFTGLTDTPGAYTSFGSYVVRVTGGEDGLEFVDPGDVGINYWDSDSGVLSPITSGDVIAATSAAQTVATFTATGANAALRAGGTTNYMSIDTNGNLIVTAGYGLDTRTAGELKLGTTNANAITIGQDGMTTTVAGNLTLTTGRTLTINGDVFTDLTGNGLTVSSNALTLLTDETDAKASGLTLGASGLSLLRTCGSGEILKWDSTNGWECSVDSTSAGGGSGDLWTLTGGGLMYPNETFYSISLGGTSTSSATFYVDSITGNATMSGTLGIGTVNQVTSFDNQLLTLEDGTGLKFVNTSNLGYGCIR